MALALMLRSACRKQGITGNQTQKVEKMRVSDKIKKINNYIKFQPVLNTLN
jgi:hypothetical protein